MGMDRKFNPREVDKLRRPERYERENPDTIWAQMALEEPDAFVDIGAGIGFAAVPFAKKMPGGKVYACDLVQEMLDILRAEAEQAGVKNIDLVKMEEVRIPLPDGIADGVLMQNLHHELLHPVESLRECRRIMKDNGRLAIIDWKKEPMEAGPPQDIRVTAETIERHMKEAGFVWVTHNDVLPFHYFIIGVK